MKNVEVIPWSLSDSNFTLNQTAQIDPRTTIFVGALHGMLNAEGLCAVMNELFGGVVHSGNNV
jgi:cytoplasmic polyadenylation element-binding protein